jgi:hypothetical protein
MNTSDIIVYIHKGSNEMREALSLAPEVAAKFGWSEGRVISETEAIDAEFLNVIHTLGECINALYDSKYVDPPFEQQGDLPSVEVSEEFWVSLREYRERRKQEEGK